MGQTKSTQIEGAIGMTQAVIYTRVSSRKQQQEGFSLDAQGKLLREYASRNGIQVECRQWCEENGFVVSRVFVEPGVSAASANRPVLEEMVNLIESQKGTIDAVVVWKFDRFARNFEDSVLLR